MTPVCEPVWRCYECRFVAPRGEFDVAAGCPLCRDQISKNGHRHGDPVPLVESVRRPDLLGANR